MNHAAKLATLIDKVDPLNQKKLDTKNELLSTMVKNNEKELTANGRTFTVVKNKKMPPFNQKNVKIMYNDYKKDTADEDFDIDEFLSFVKRKRKAGSVDAPATLKISKPE